MKVLIVDKMSENVVKALKDMGAEVTVNAVKAEDLPHALGDTEVLVVRSTKVSAAAIDAAPALSLIVRAGAGVNTIDVAAASQRGIYVANCPGQNTDAVAELAIGLLIAADRRIVNATNDLRAGRWKKGEYGKARGLKGRVLGIVGLGSIGKAVAKRAQGLEMNVLAWSRSLTPERAKELDLGYCATLEELAAHSDAVSIHVAATSETKNLIGGEFFARMKKGAVLINTSRGEVIDPAALKAAIAEKGLRVGLDVYAGEPAGSEAEFPDKELAAAVIGTPHIGASTDQASEAIAAETVRVIETYQRYGHPVNTVNIQEKTHAVINLIVRHFNRVGVLAGVLDELRNEGVNIEEMENIIFEEGAAACCTLKLDDKPSRALLAKLGQAENVIQVMLK